MRRFWIHHVLPLAFCLIPVLGAGLVFAAVPVDARRDYLARVQESGLDWIILALGFTLFAGQTVLAWRALRWRVADANFDEGADRWLTHLAQGAEWFPLLGLIGTVAAILQTFSSITPGSNPTPQDIIKKYAPAITATGSGLFMALINILPTWVVAAGRDLIRALGGYAPVPGPPVQAPPASGPSQITGTPVGLGGANNAPGGRP
ncbi:MAG: MotA/TolQ/ExbB proton channel family protein [Gemmataceae bacterium]|nr:MotA/TolQ/ExbB proton channel family protein [Gemmataceae bacterium]